MLPAVTPNMTAGLPRAIKASADRQGGCAMMPTRKPCVSSTRPMRAAPKLGWSTYASPVTRTTSQASQPRASISERDMGSTGATPSRLAQWALRANSVGRRRVGETIRQRCSNGESSGALGDMAGLSLAGSCLGAWASQIPIDSSASRDVAYMGFLTWFPWSNAWTTDDFVRVR